MINTELKEYIEKNIIPNYANFDKGHNFEHVNTVINESLKLAQTLDLNANMAYTIAAYHDLGLCKEREIHHTVSGQILINDSNLKKWFTNDEIILMKEAVEDHRASSKNEPRSIYGKVIAEADRVIDPINTIKRTLLYSIKQSPKASKEEHFQHVVEHMDKKYAEGGYLKLWFENSNNAQKLEELRKIIAQPEKLKSIFEQLYELETTSL